MGGFFGKYFIFKELVKTNHVGLAVLGVTASLVSVYYYLRVVVALFLEQPSESQVRAASEKPEVQSFLSTTTVLICAAIILAGGFLPEFPGGWLRRQSVERRHRNPALSVLIDLWPFLSASSIASA